MKNTDRQLGEGSLSLPIFEFPALEMLIGIDFLSMSLQTKGAYITLLSYCSVKGSIPSDVIQLALICRCSDDDMASMWHELSNHFVKEEGSDRYVSAVVERFRTKQTDNKKKKVMAGRLGAEASRLKRQSAQKSGNAQALETSDFVVVGVNSYFNKVKENNNNNSHCSSTAENLSRPRIWFNPDRSRFEGITADDMEKWQGAFAHVDVSEKIRELEMYLDSRPNKQAEIAESSRVWLTNCLNRQNDANRDKPKKDASNEKRSIPLAATLAGLTTAHHRAANNPNNPIFDINPNGDWQRLDTADLG